MSSASFDFRGRSVPLLSKMYINGEWVSSATTMPVFAPEFGKNIHSVAQADESHVKAAVEAAKACVEGPDWGNSTTGKQRAAILRKMADEIEARKDHIADLEMIDVGKPKPEATEDIGFTVNVLKYLAKQAEDLDEHQQGKTVVLNEDFTGATYLEPYGVVGAITPWNYPFMMAVQKVGAALAGGNAVVLKPSENTMLSSLEFASIVEASGLPKGALNVVCGYGNPTGSLLVSNPDVNMISFTGSVPTGTNIMKAAADGIRHVHLELGGKSAMIVLDDADVATAVDWILCGIYFNAGQVCSATSRVLVHASLWEEISSKVVEAAKKIHAGPPLDAEDEAHRIGPIISQPQLDRVVGFIERAKKSGISAACGGNVVAGVDGLFVQPTVFVNVPETAEIWTEEIFGPVMCMRPFNTEAEAIASANSSRFGLAGAVMGSAERCAPIVKKLKAGTVWVNNSQPVFPETPFGGFKQSGFGRELGEHAVREFMQIKQVTSCARGFTWSWFAKTD